MFPELEPVIGDGELDFKERAKASYSTQEKEEQVWGDINSAFSEPISPNDTHLSYLPPSTWLRF